ncbi:MAG: protein translocase subunit SecF [Candidatus Parcubacteria bacterium]|nr:protein translocase subunit SecF [Candidatus Parcubacteria bacterium]
MGIVKYRKIWYIFSILLVLASLFSIFYFRLNFSIDFTGGSLLEVEYNNSRPDTAVIQSKLSGLNLGNISIQPTGEKGLIIRLKTINEEEHQNLLSILSSTGPFNEIHFDSIGPTIGKELAQKSIYAVIIVIAMIILYIAFAFRKVSKPVSSFKYGLMAVAALIHDVTAPIGIFAVLGKYAGTQIDILFVTAILTVLGFSVHDTIVVFDRIRENLRKNIGKDFEETVGTSINQTIVRSINTSLTVIFVLFALFLFGGETIKYFSLALIVGVFFGTYSSIFLASPLLVTLYKFQSRKNYK